MAFFIFPGIPGVVSSEPDCAKANVAKDNTINTPVNQKKREFFIFILPSISKRPKTSLINPTGAVVIRFLLDKPHTPKPYLELCGIPPSLRITSRVGEQ
jgi:hypothetical protein